MPDEVDIEETEQTETQGESETPTQETTTDTPDLWISVDQVIAFHGLKPQHLNIKKMMQMQMLNSKQYSQIGYSNHKTSSMSTQTANTPVVL